MDSAGELVADHDPRAAAGSGSGAFADPEAALAQTTAWVESFYDAFIDRTPDACLDPDRWAPDQGYGDPITFILRIIIALLVALRFIMWQRAHADDPPAQLPIADLESEYGRIQCLPLKWFRPSPKLLGLRCGLLGALVEKPCEHVHTGMWQGFIFTWPVSADS